MASAWGLTGFQGPPPALGNWLRLCRSPSSAYPGVLYYDDPESDGFSYGAPRAKALNAVAEGDEFSTGDKTR
ncbi:MAG: hypothetical protein R2857_01585 [Vampirovibrionales bacterium]